MRKIRTIAVIAFMALALQASAKDPKWLKSVRNSVFNVVAYDTDGRELSRSRGFFISTDGTGITDRSVLVGADKAVTIDAAGTTRQIQVVTGADDIYDAVYSGFLDDIYDDIYDGVLDDVYDDFYDGLLDDAYEHTEYKE